ncbi:hypothetical protein F0L68_26950 [Solihabitans fulvus]|uniref:Uncharacterized protein n=1 Tax=Solihabitans fulvus TaxID=1892852 RepID=A0A5B2X0W0_9PSEU|nr:hypothetical protein [Solihabitans fulvus]KAA2256087.1 hypothetical protein F0L68_26950 [Solihabitans fulvus]
MTATEQSIVSLAAHWVDGGVERITWREDSGSLASFLLVRIDIARSCWHSCGDVIAAPRQVDLVHAGTVAQEALGRLISCDVVVVRIGGVGYLVRGREGECVIREPRAGAAMRNCATAGYLWLLDGGDLRLLPRSSVLDVVRAVGWRSGEPRQP